jgi:integrase
MSSKPKKNPSGTWSQVIDLPSDPATGKRRQKRITAATKKELEILAAATIHAAATGFIEPRSVTFGQFWERWCEAKAPTLSPSTARRYRDLGRLHLAAFKAVRLAKIGPEDVQRLYADRLATGLSGTSVRHLHSVLHSALDDAVKWGLVARNVCDAVKAPARNRTEMQTWNPAQARAILAAAAGDDLEALWRLAITTGMRRGELLGLKWADVDFDANALSVRRSLSRGGSSRLIEREPKTEAGRRRIALSPETTESLRRHRVRQLEYRLSVGIAYEDRDLVFTNPLGAYLHPNTLMRSFARLTKAANVPTIRFHDLRHTSATLLLAEGVHPKIVQERLGHSDIAMTLNRYSHVTPHMQTAAAAALETALKRVS